MEKIEFKNYPDTSTPINAENLNAIQNNVETAIYGKAEWFYAGRAYPNTDTTFILNGDMWLIALPNSFGTHGLYVVSKVTAEGQNTLRITQLIEQPGISVTAVDSRTLKITAGQIECPVYIQQII